jgi:hypothetical protein
MRRLTLSSVSRQVAITPMLRFAAIACAVAAILAAWALWDALRVDALPTATPGGWSRPTLARYALHPTTSEALVDGAVELDPFRPERERPGVRYGAAPATEVAQAGGPAGALGEQASAVRLLGTVVDSVGGSFAVCQFGNAIARVVRIGESCGSYRLRSIAQGVALFVDDGGERLELRVSTRRN